ncbi:hypothetical protein CIB95_03930 [Lottiidibacillus patelloidae]|uniref:DUF4878 domain-containing protein n=1 Tax=Lottiidibacillus patelloidae TaxID=2670334 RepID=A0A263BVD4_9BACI|nr:hypothetical protein [Lottiidibacillus patelloidae]OZM57528.1 hypothetical protein CIB95_03930 [Lottiidibacillus patelloidae]
MKFFDAKWKQVLIATIAIIIGFTVYNNYFSTDTPENTVKIFLEAYASGDDKNLKIALSEELYERFNDTLENISLSELEIFEIETKKIVDNVAYVYFDMNNIMLMHEEGQKDNIIHATTLRMHGFLQLEKQDNRWKIVEFMTGSFNHY